MRTGKRFNLPVIGRWFILGSIVGLVAGIGAIIFFLLLQGSAYIFMDYLMGMRVEETAGEPAHFGHATTELKRWTIFFIPALGGLISGFLVYKFAPEAEGHGTDAAIKAIHYKKRLHSLASPDNQNSRQCYHYRNGWFRRTRRTNRTDWCRFCVIFWAVL